MGAIHVTQGRCLVELMAQKTELSNGLKLNNETQSRKDIVSGLVIDGKYKDSMVYFPKYAASPIALQGKAYVVVHEDDIYVVVDNDSRDN